MEMEPYAGPDDFLEKLRRAREMVVQMLLGQRDVLDGHGVAAALELPEAIDPKPTHI